jgi:hypothetical protein
MVKISTVASYEQYPYSPYIVPYGPYELFPKIITKKAETHLIDSLSILLTLHYKRTPPVAFRGVFRCSNL